MSNKIERNYLEIKSLTDLKVSSSVPEGYEIQIIKPSNFQLNKFFYKNVGKKHHWVDRLIWKEKEWIQYVSDERVKTYVLKKNEDMASQSEESQNNAPSEGDFEQSHSDADADERSEEKRL